MTDLVADRLKDCMGLHHRCDHVRIQGEVARGGVMTDQGRGDPSANSHTNNTARNLPTCNLQGEAHWLKKKKYYQY